MVTWVLEANVFSEKCFDEMVAHLKSRGVSYHIVKVIPFVHEIDGKVPELTGPVVVYGSIGAQKIAQRHGWTPGVWTDLVRFSEAEADKHLGDLMLNHNANLVQFSAVSDYLKLFYHPEAPFFIKPNTDTKEFAGTTMLPSEFEAWKDKMLSIGYLDDNDFPVVVSPAKTLGCEWRCVVVNGEISSASLYRQYQRVMAERHILPEVAALVKETMKKYQPAPVYVIDVAQVGDEFKVVEFNTFNSAGLYECDVGKIIDDINAYLG
jgi:hypothetical protein